MAPLDPESRDILARAEEPVFALLTFLPRPALSETESPIRLFRCLLYFLMAWKIVARERMNDIHAAARNIAGRRGVVVNCGDQCASSATMLVIQLASKVLESLGCWELLEPLRAVHTAIDRVVETMPPDHATEWQREPSDERPAGGLRSPGGLASIAAGGAQCWADGDDEQAEELLAQCRPHWKWGEEAMQALAAPAREIREPLLRWGSDLLADLRRLLPPDGLARLRAELEIEYAGLAAEQKATTDPHPDGPEGGRWLWWENKRKAIPRGNVYRLLAYMWNRDAAGYDDLIDNNVFESEVQPQTVRSYVNKANTALTADIPWRLSADSVNRQVTRNTKT